MLSHADAIIQRKVCLFLSVVFISTYFSSLKACSCNYLYPIARRDAGVPFKLISIELDGLISFFLESESGFGRRYDASEDRS
jgi:hypothetical protein